ncbi:MAG: exo-alpha-sialidase [Clostridiales bacterium]|nr:exo-alpha-sialidase [Clostridiales bacterium]
MYHANQAAWNVKDLSLNIKRLSPGDACLELSWNYPNKGRAAGDVFFELTFGKAGEKQEGLKFNINETSAKLSGLENGCDYEVTLYVKRPGKNRPVEKSASRLFRPGLVPGRVVNYIHPDDFAYGFSGRSPASPSILKLPDGSLLASHDIFWSSGGQNLTKIFRSDDEGRNWEFLTDLYPCFWGKLFLYQGQVYMLGTSTEYGDLLIGKSQDGGKTWGEPTVLIKGGDGLKGGPHKAPLPLVEHKGRLWAAIDYGAWLAGGHASGVISAPLGSDLLLASSWTISPFLAYDKTWPGTVEGPCNGLLEGNPVVSPQNELFIILRYQTIEAKPSYGKALMLKVVEADAPLEFHKAIDFEGNLSKFTISYDEKSKRYWSLVNKVTSKNLKQRNVLSLVTSKDLENWEEAEEILNYENNAWPEDSSLVGFQYVDWIFDGDDILALSRTAINGANNFHDANYITFHKIKNFRSKI